MKTLKEHFGALRSLCFLGALFLVGISSTLQAQVVANAVQFVSTAGSDSNSGLSWGSAVADISNAYGNLPSCTVPALGGNLTWSHCGTIYVGAGTYTVSSTVAINGPVYVIGVGTNSTLIQSAVSSGCVLSFTANPYNPSEPGDNFGGVFNLTILGPSNPVSNICGLQTFDMIGFRAANVAIAGFTGTGNSGWWNETIQYWNERFNVSMTIQNNTIDALFQNTNSSSSETFGYGNLELWMNVESGQQALVSEGYSSTYGVAMFNEFVSIHINGGNSSTCGSFTNDSSWQITGVLYCENSDHPATSQTGFTTDSSSVLVNLGQYVSPGPDSGNITAITLAAPNGNSAGQLDITNPVPATSSSPSNSPPLCFLGNYWNGSSSALDEYCLWDNVNGGANGNTALLFSHAGSSGKTALISAPGMTYTLQPSSGGGSLSLGLASGTYTGFPLVNFPPLSGLAGVNGQATNGFYVAVRGVSGCETDYGNPSDNCDTPITVTWPTAFPDTNYTAVCAPSGPPAGAPSAPYVASKSTGSITVNYIGVTGATASWQQIDCVAVHD